MMRCSLRLRESLMDETAYVNTFFNATWVKLMYFGSFTKEVAPKWRLAVAEKVWIECQAASEGGEEMFERFIQALPFLLHTLGPIAKPFVQRVLDDILATFNSKKCMIALAKSAGILVCALTKRTRLQRRIATKENNLIEAIVCPHCSRDFDPIQQPASTLYPPKIST